MNRALIKFRAAHRVIARVSLVFIAVSGVTGLLWALRTLFYWDADYMTRKHEILSPPLTAARIDVHEALHQLGMHAEAKIEPVSVSLRGEVGRLIYELYYLAPDAKPQTALVDAVSGDWLSPLRREDAIRFARQYIEGEPRVESAELLENWVSRKAAKKERPAWRIGFADPGRTEIFSDPFTGGILEDQDASRRFHFFIMKLHQFHFFGTNKELTILSGLPLLVLLTTGLWLAFPKLVANVRRRISQVGRQALATARVSLRAP